MPYTTPTSTSPDESAAMGAGDRQAANELRYKRYIEHLAGFAPGELDLSDEEILRRRALAQARTEAGAAQAANLADPAQASSRHLPFEAVLSALKTRPGMIEHLEGIDLDGDGHPDAMPPTGPPPMAPVGRMNWQAMMAQRQSRMQALRQHRLRQKEVNNRVILAHLQAHDPLFPQVYRKVIEFVHRLPAKLQRPFLRAVDETPGAYLDLYREMREVLLRHAGHSGPAARRTMPSPEDPRAAIRRAVAGRMSPPVLESAGTVDDRLPGASRAAELAALKARCKAGKAREGDLLRYIELTMRDGPR